MWGWAGDFSRALVLRFKACADAPSSCIARACSTPNPQHCTHHHPQPPTFCNPKPPNPQHFSQEQACLRHARTRPQRHCALQNQAHQGRRVHLRQGQETRVRPTPLNSPNFFCVTTPRTHLCVTTPLLPRASPPPPPPPARYSLFHESDAGDVFMLSARRRKKSKTSNYLLSLDQVGSCRPQRVLVPLTTEP